MNLLFLIAPLLTTALYHLGARAMITQPLWSRYPAWLDKVAQCAACSGFWYGVLIAVLGAVFNISFLGMTGWGMIPIVGLCSLVWTPLLAAKQEQALDYLTGGAPYAGTAE